jgi:hypothetical protein
VARPGARVRARRRHGRHRPRRLARAALPAAEEWFGRISREIVFSGFFDVGTIKFRHKPTDLDLQQESFTNRSTLTGIGIGAVWDRSEGLLRPLSLACPLSGEARQRHKKEPAHLLPRQQDVLSSVADARTRAAAPAEPVNRVSVE